MKRITRYSVLVICIVSLVLVLTYIAFQMLWGTKTVYRTAEVVSANKAVTYRVDSIRVVADEYTVCFEDINEEAPTLNTTYKGVPVNLKEGGTYRANWLRVTAKIGAVQAYKDWIAMDFTNYTLTDATIERIKIETIDALALMYKEHYKPYLRIVQYVCMSLEIVTIVCVVIFLMYERERLKENITSEIGGTKCE